ncbi:microtubule-associated protein futsch, partial [Thrips palmi]|uniref:Microtubule-associated protein futsch n=1 Tax=Thrips palmi TaxID=161013 RepID=A0A6P8Y904_THRPL
EAVAVPAAAGGHPPPSPLSGGYLLIIIGEPHSAEHRDLILQRVAKGFLSWDSSDCHVDLEKELSTLSSLSPKGEEARSGERLVQYASESLVTEVLVHPQVNTLLQCVRNLLSSFTRHRHILHAGYTFAGTGSWILQDGTFSYADLAELFHEPDVQRVLRAYENSVSVDVHCCAEGPWRDAAASAQPFTRYCKVRVNPPDVLTAGSAAISGFIDYVSDLVQPAMLESLLEPSDVVGNIRFSHPTLYVFPGGQGDAALFGINGFNMLVDGGFGRKSCFWDFARHLDRLDAVLLTRLNNANAHGLASLLRRKRNAHVYPQIGHFFCNLQDRKVLTSPDGDKDRDNLLVSLVEEGQEMVLNLRHLQLKPSPCYRDSVVEPVNLYHKVGHGKLDMYVVSPARDSREVKEFLAKWSANDAKLFASHLRKDSKDFQFPLQNMVSICALLVWQPANPQDNITRILFPGSTPQVKIFEGLDKIRHLEYLKHPRCTAKSLSPSSSIVGLSSRTQTKKYTPTVLDKITPGEQQKTYSRTVPTTESSKHHVLKTATIPITGGATETKVYRATTTTTVSATTVASAKVSTKKSEKSIKIESEKQDKNEKSEKENVMAENKQENGDISKEEKAKQTEVVKVKSKVRQTSHSRERKATRVQPSDRKDIDKKEKKEDKTSPTTPKKSLEGRINGVSTRSESASRVQTRSSSKTRRSPSATPAKSAKEANNRKVAESKVQSTRSVSVTRTSTKTSKKEESSETHVKTKSVEKPVTRRVKPTSPSKVAKVQSSPSKGTQTKPVSAKTERPAPIRKSRASEKDEAEKKIISMSTVNTNIKEALVLESNKPSNEEEQENKNAEESGNGIVIEVTELDTNVANEEKQEQADENLSSTQIISGEEDEKKSEDEGRSQGAEAEVEEEDEDEYLVIEKEEPYTEESFQDQVSAESHVPAGSDDRGLSDEDGEDEKLRRDTQESEKVKEVEKPRKKSEAKLTMQLTDKEHAEQILKSSTEECTSLERKFSLKTDTTHLVVDDVISPENKDKIVEEVQDIILSATEIVSKKEEKLSPEGEKREAEDSDEKEKNLVDEELKCVDGKQASSELKEESHPDEKMSTTAESGATTAPTLPEDERIPLDDIKEVVEEKHVLEDTKEKDRESPKDDVGHEQSVPDRPVHFEIRGSAVSALHRDMIKTPDEVADLPVDEEYDLMFNKEEQSRSPVDVQHLPEKDTPREEMNQQGEKSSPDVLKEVKQEQEEIEQLKDIQEKLDAEANLDGNIVPQNTSETVVAAEKVDSIRNNLSTDVEANDPNSDIVISSEKSVSKSDVNEKDIDTKKEKEVHIKEEPSKIEASVTGLQVVQKDEICVSLEELRILGHQVEDLKPSEIKRDDAKYVEIEPSNLREADICVDVGAKPMSISISSFDEKETMIEKDVVSTSFNQDIHGALAMVAMPEPLEVVQEDVYLESSVEEEPVYGQTDSPALPEYVTVTPDSSPEGSKSPSRKKSTGSDKNEGRKSSLAKGDSRKSSIDKIDSRKSSIVEKETEMQTQELAANLLLSEKLKMDTATKVASPEEQGNKILIADSADLQENIQPSTTTTKAESTDLTGSSTKEERTELTLLSGTQSPQQAVQGADSRRGSALMPDTEKTNLGTADFDESVTLHQPQDLVSNALSEDVSSSTLTVSPKKETSAIQIDDSSAKPIVAEEKSIDKSTPSQDQKLLIQEESESFHQFATDLKLYEDIIPALVTKSVSGLTNDNLMLKTTEAICKQDAENSPDKRVESSVQPLTVKEELDNVESQSHTQRDLIEISSSDAVINNEKRQSVTVETEERNTITLEKVKQITSNAADFEQISPKKETSCDKKDLGVTSYTDKEVGKEEQPSEELLEEINSPIQTDAINLSDTVDSKTNESGEKSPLTGMEANETADRGDGFPKIQEVLEKRSSIKTETISVTEISNARETSSQEQQVSVQTKVDATPENVAIDSSQLTPGKGEIIRLEGNIPGPLDSASKIIPAEVPLVQSQQVNLHKSEAQSIESNLNKEANETLKDLPELTSAMSESPGAPQDKKEKRDSIQESVSPTVKSPAKSLESSPEKGESRKGTSSSLEQSCKETAKNLDESKAVDIRNSQVASEMTSINETVQIEKVVKEEVVENTEVVDKSSPSVHEYEEIETIEVTKSSSEKVLSPDKVLSVELNTLNTVEADKGKEDTSLQLVTQGETVTTILETIPPMSPNSLKSSNAVSPEISPKASSPASPEKNTSEVSKKIADKKVTPPLSPKDKVSGSVTEVEKVPSKIHETKESPVKSPAPAVTSVSESLTSSPTHTTAQTLSPNSVSPEPTVTKQLPVDCDIQAHTSDLVTTATSESVSTKSSSEVISEHETAKISILTEERSSQIITEQGTCAVEHSSEVQSSTIQLSQESFDEKEPSESKKLKKESEDSEKTLVEKDKQEKSAKDAFKHCSLESSTSAFDHKSDGTGVHVQQTDLNIATDETALEEERKSGATTPSILVTGCKTLARQSQPSESDSELPEEDLKRQDDVFEAAVTPEDPLLESSEKGSSSSLENLVVTKEEDSKDARANLLASETEQSGLSHGEILAIKKSSLDLTREFLEAESKSHTDATASDLHKSSVLSVGHSGGILSAAAIPATVISSVLVGVEKAEAATSPMTPLEPTGRTVIHGQSDFSDEKHESLLQTQIKESDSSLNKHTAENALASAGEIKIGSRSEETEEPEFTLVSKSVHEEYVNVPFNEDGECKKLAATTTVSTFTAKDVSDSPKHGDLTKTVTTVTKITTDKDGSDAMETTTTEEVLSEGKITSVSTKTEMSPLHKRSTPEPQEEDGSDNAQQVASYPSSSEERGFASECVVDPARILLESAVVSVVGGVASVSKNVTTGFDDAMSAGLSVLSSVVGVRKDSLEATRSCTPASDIDMEPSTPHSDISSGQVSRAPTNISESDFHPESEDDDVPGSPTSLTSQVTHSPPPHFDFGVGETHRSGARGSQDDQCVLETKASTQVRRQTIAAPMTTSMYGAISGSPLDENPKDSTGTQNEPMMSSVYNLPEEKTTSLGGSVDIMSSSMIGEFSSSNVLEFDQAVEEHRAARGTDLTKSTENVLSVLDSGFSDTSSLVSKPEIIQEKPQSSSIHFSETQTSHLSEEVKEGAKSVEDKTAASKTKDPIAGWGEPLGLPSPVPPPTNEEPVPSPKGTPQKDRLGSRKPIVDNKKRPESPRRAKGSKSNAIYIDLTYVPHHGNSYYTSLEFFKRVRARYYVFSGIEPSREVYNALLEAKQTWEDKELEVTIIPTYDTDTLGYWVAENEDALAKYKIDLSPSASRCTINLQDHETSCSAYRLEF